MSHLILLRHGETDLAGRFCGHSDPPLNANGVRQATQQAATLTPLYIDRIYTSPLQRARQTAAQIAQTCGAAVEVVTDLAEIDFGAWEGLLWSEIETRWPDEAANWVAEFPHRPAPRGEDYSAFCARVDACFATLAADLRRPTVFVTHRGVLQRLLTHAFDLGVEEARECTAPYCACLHLEWPCTKRTEPDAARR